MTLPDFSATLSTTTWLAAQGGRCAKVRWTYADSGWDFASLG
ncbi:MAG TPA: hypothetical protein VGP93_01740 [Polyangiaceae bacterium]|nr:hypothetical protein [Polyangiaceae bacterium]